MSLPELYDRLLALSGQVGLGQERLERSAAFQALLADVAGLPDDAERAELEGRTLGVWATHVAQLGRPEAAADLHRRAERAFRSAGQVARAEQEAVGAAEQGVAAGQPVDALVTALRAQVAAASGVDRATSAVRLARLLTDLGDRFEAPQLVASAAADLGAAGLVDPTADPQAAWTAWHGDPATAQTWVELLGLRARLGDAAAEPALAALVALVDRELGLGGSRGSAVVALSQRLGALQDAYDAGPDVADPAQVEQLVGDLEQVRRDGRALGHPLVVASAAVLAGDVLVWGGRSEEADALLATAERELAEVTDLSPLARDAQRVQLLRRRVQVAAARDDDAAVSQLAGEAIALVEASRGRVSLPYLDDGLLRDLGLVYVLGIAAARRQGDGDLVLERMDLLKAQGVLEGLGVPPWDVRQVRASLADDEAVVSWLWLTRTLLLVVTADRERVVCDRRPLTDAQRDDLDGLAADITALTGVVRWLDSDLPPLGRLLLPDPALLEGKARLFLSPHGVLHGLPLHTLDLGGRPLLEHAAVTYVPNVAALTPRAAPSKGPALVVGLPAAPGLAPLPSVPREVEGVAAAWPGSDVLLGPLATCAALQERAQDGRLEHARLLHLATHGDDGPREDPLAAHLVLADGRLDGAALRSWRLGADLVVLSACWSAQRAVVGRDGGELFADEVYGLQSAFFAAGARQVLGSLWPAADETAASVMAGFHLELAAGQPADVALQRAVLAIRTEAPLLYNWGAYQLVALGRQPQGVPHG